MSRILIVEDDHSVRDFTARALRAAGHAVETAADGLAGIERVRIENGDFHLVLSDIRMPVMDGIEMAGRLAADHPGIPILLMTGYADQRERAADLAGTVIDVIDKPFTLAELRRRVEMALAARPSTVSVSPLS
jgi:CheY-like chemotaxis protein